MLEAEKSFVKKCMHPSADHVKSSERCLSTPLQPSLKVNSGLPLKQKSAGAKEAINVFVPKTQPLLLSLHL
jgi:hypothetical protein